MISTRPLLITSRIQSVNFRKSFEQLNEEEKNYAFYLSKACWAGQPIILFQTSYESPALFIIFQTFFHSFQAFSDIKTTLLKQNISDINYTGFIKYAARFYSNFGNFSVGEKKFFPSIRLEDFETILKTSNKFNEISSIWELIKYTIYDDSLNASNINLEENNGKNCYYYGGIKEEQIKNVDDKLKKNNYSLINTKIFMLYSSSKTAVLIGSIEEKQVKLDEEIILLYGEYSTFLKRINEYLEEAKTYALNDSEKEIINEYIDSFKTGEIDKHKESQRKWVKDSAPSIDFNLGWIETLIDPMGVRGCYEGWVGIADKENTQKYEQIVSLIPQLLSDLPWDENFERECKSIEFNALDVVCFGRNGCPTGKCLPKYRDIREDVGIKDISFINCFYNYSSKENDLLYCETKDVELIMNFGNQASRILSAAKQIGNGSGKLLRILSNEGEEKKFNFNPQLINPLTGAVIDKYYNKNESFEERFTSLAPILSECHSILIGLYCGSNGAMQELFHVNECEYKDVTYIMWLMLFRQGIMGLPLFNKEKKKWNHAKTEAAWIITKYILDNQKEGEEILKVEIEEEKEIFHILASKEMICCFSNELVSKLLLKLHIWKCIGDVESFSNFAKQYSEVDDKFLKIKEIIGGNDLQWELYLYPNLIHNDDGSVSYKEYPETNEGIIESNLDRFGTDYNKEIYNQWVKYATDFIKI